MVLSVSTKVTAQILQPFLAGGEIWMVALLLHNVQKSQYHRAPIITRVTKNSVRVLEIEPFWNVRENVPHQSSSYAQVNDALRI